MTALVVRIDPWRDEVIETLGHDPRSAYVETYWLGILGPTTTFLLRHIADRFDDEPDGFDLDVVETGKRLGVGGTGKHSPLMRSLNRLVAFHVARQHDDGLAVLRKLAPLTERQAARLPASLQATVREAVPA